jgi:Ca-activated chloride channel family protein
MIGDFHFLRPWWLLACLPAAVLLWAIWRRHHAARIWDGIVAPHLLPHLLSEKSDRRSFGPFYLIGVGWLVTIIAIAGPTWRREPAPFAEDTAALAIVLKVSPSMKTEDIQPDRLTRSVQKIHDLLAERRGAKTSLVAYAATAHLVMPVTADGGIIDTFAQSLDPKIMPADGDSAADALRLADQTLAETGSGSILWITDSIAPDEVKHLEEWRRKSKTPVRLLAPLLSGSEMDALSKSARTTKARVTQISPDDTDVAELARAAKFSTAPTGQQNDRWQEAGYFLTLFIGALLLPFFRRGWMAETGAQA